MPLPPLPLRDASGKVADRIPSVEGAQTVSTERVVLTESIAPTASRIFTQAGIGDIRQLPPAIGKQPFWATAMFQKYVGIFVLREDRRHEPDA